MKPNKPRWRDLPTEKRIEKKLRRFGASEKLLKVIKTGTKIMQKKSDIGSR